MGVNVEDGKIQNAASKLGCLVLKTPFTYLGMKVGENMSRNEAWKEVVDKVLSRLSKWKTKTLSIGVYKGGVETTSHLFFQCVLSKQIMRKVSSWWNDDYTDVSSYEEWRLWLVSIRILNKLKSMMEGVFYASFKWDDWLKNPILISV
nr:RNA-directed DNA polymerase, eukaryota [Tanacetum cinerariifolium]